MIELFVLTMQNLDKRRVMNGESEGERRGKSGVWEGERILINTIYLIHFQYFC